MQTGHSSQGGRVLLLEAFGNLVGRVNVELLDAPVKIVHSHGQGGKLTVERTQAGLKA